MKRDVLLTGATGLIGGEIAVRLMRAGHRVWCVVRSRTFAEAAARLERRFSLSGDQCDWSRLVALPGDVTTERLGLGDDTVNHLRRECAHVIHCAADTSFATHNRCEPVNIAGTRNVLGLCGKLGPRVRLFHMSSAVTCLKSGSGTIQEDDAPAGFSNDYVLSKRQCEQLILRAPIDGVILRPSIVLSQGVNSREFARSILWVLPVIRQLGVLPLSGDEPIDAVNVNFVAEAVASLLHAQLDHRTYHISAGPESSVTWKELFDALNRFGRDYGDVRFDPDMNWASFGQSDPRLRRLKGLLNHYLPFMRAGAAYGRARLNHALAGRVPPCLRLTDYCAELLDLISEREALEEALKP